MIVNTLTVLLIINIFMVAAIMSFFIYHIVYTDTSVKELVKNDYNISNHLVGPKILQQQNQIMDKLNILSREVELK